MYQVPGYCTRHKYKKALPTVFPPNPVTVDDTHFWFSKENVLSLSIDAAGSQKFFGP
jgi:hypothetical protein